MVSIVCLILTIHSDVRCVTNRFSEETCWSVAGLRGDDLQPSLSADRAFALAVSAAVIVTLAALFVLPSDNEKSQDIRFLSVLFPLLATALSLMLPMHLLVLGGELDLAVHDIAIVATLGPVLLLALAIKQQTTITTASPNTIQMAALEQA